MATNFLGQGEGVPANAPPLGRKALLELRRYRGDTGKRVMAGLLLLVFAGLVGYLTVIGKPEAMTLPWLTRTFGLRAAQAGGAIEALASLGAGIWLFRSAWWRMTVGIRAREQRLLNAAAAAAGGAAATAQRQATPVKTLAPGSGGAQKPTPAIGGQAGRKAAPAAGGQGAKAGAAAVGGAAGKPPGKVLTPVQHWAVAVGANLTITWEHEWDALALPNGAEKTREVLGRQWSIRDSASAERMFDWLRREGHSASFEEMLQAVTTLRPSQIEALLATQDAAGQRDLRFAAEQGSRAKDGKLVAWDMVRLSFLARGTHTAGLVDEAAAWKVALEAARKLQRSYGSWAEMSENFLVGREFWGEASAESMAAFHKNATWLLTSKRSPWTQLPWDLPLAAVHPS